MIFCRKTGVAGLFGGQGEGLTIVLDHLAHFANAFGALCRALVAHEDIARLGRASLDCEGDVTLAKTVAVADVQGGISVENTENGSL